MLKFALKNMAIRRTKLIMTALSVVITAAVALMAYNISTQVSEGIVNTAAKYDIIIGPSGSATQLAMNTMFFTDKPLGTIPYSLLDEINRTGLANEVIPFSMGDSYNAAPIVGTAPSFLEGKTLKSGEMFSEALDAVVGYSVAQQYGLKVGDQLITSHGLNTAGAEHADHPLTVTGILNRSDTAYDNAVFTPVSTVWLLHDHEEEEGGEHHDEAEEAGHAAEESHDSAEDADHEEDGDHAEAEVAGHAAEESHAEAEDAGHEEDGDHAEAQSHEDHDHAEGGEICAVLIRSTGFNAYTQLMSAYGSNADYLAINPNTVLREVMDNVDLSRRIVYILCAVILVMNLFVVSVIALLNMYDSRKEISLMRLIGISMGRINQLYLIQNAIAGLVAMLLSMLAAHLCLLGIRSFVASMGIVLNWRHIYPVEWLILLVVFILSILPTMICTRQMARRDSLES